MSARHKRIRFWLLMLLVMLLVFGGAAGVYRLRQVQASVSYPMAPARKGEFLVIIRCRGELKAGRSAAVYAPIVPALRISWMAPSGEPVKQGDPIIRFDSS